MEAPLATAGNGRKKVKLDDPEHSIRSSVNKFASQIKKLSHLKSPSPLNWIPRKKTDSFLKRKIKLLQEGDGMSLSLVETLGNANPHYTRIAREKIAAQEAASNAMKARKAAMVEASWCRILQAARIQRKDAESKLEKAEMCAAEAFEKAKLMGVMMFDRPDYPRRSCEISSSLATGEKSANPVSASFETEFEVDREVAAAVRKAIIILANCPSFSNKKEFRGLLRKIRQNPDDYEALTASPQFEFDHSCGLEPELHATIIGTENIEMHNEARHRKSSYGILLDRYEVNSSNSAEDLVSMVDRLKELHEDELSSLATIVATCGLNAALFEMQSRKDHENEHHARGGMRRRSNVDHLIYASKKKKEDITNVPSLDKFLVKHVSRLEREIQECKNSQKQKPKDNHEVENKITSFKQPDAELILLASAGEKEEKRNLKCNKHVSKYLADEKNVALELREITNGNLSKSDLKKKSISHDIRAKLRTRNSFSCQSVHEINDFQQASLDKILVKPVHRLEREKLNADLNANMPSVKIIDRQVENVVPLDEILLKNQLNLEKNKVTAVHERTDTLMQKRRQHVEKIESFDEILVKHQSKLERVKLEATQNSENSNKIVDARREARERELQEAWGGLSLGNSLRPHLSKLEKDKAAWRRAEQEAKKHKRER